MLNAKNRTLPPTFTNITYNTGEHSSSFIFYEQQQPQPQQEPQPQPTHASLSPSPASTPAPQQLEEEKEEEEEVEVVGATTNPKVIHCTNYNAKFRPMTAESKKQYNDIYGKMVDCLKWKLQSGRYVEDVLYGYGLTLTKER
ncbi:unnamed protein product [Absidia cylindrospora]